MADYFRLPLIEMEPGHTLEPTHCGYYKTVRDMWKNGRYKGILIYDYGYDEQEEKKAEEVYKKSLESPGRSSFGVGSVLVALFFYLLFLLEPLTSMEPVEYSVWDSVGSVVLAHFSVLLAYMISSYRLTDGGDITKKYIDKEAWARLYAESEAGSDDRNRRKKAGNISLKVIYVIFVIVAALLPFLIWKVIL